MATGSVVVSGRTMNSGRAELAERDREREARPRRARRARAIRRSTSRHTRARCRAEHRRGLAQARVDRLEHRQHHAHDERDRDERVRDRDDRRRGSEVERRRVERDQEPEPDGHRRDAEREHDQHVEQPRGRAAGCGARRRARTRPRRRRPARARSRSVAYRSDVQTASDRGLEEPACSVCGRARGTRRIRAPVPNERVTSTAIGVPEEHRHEARGSRRANAARPRAAGRVLASLAARRPSASVRRPRAQPADRRARPAPRRAARSRARRRPGGRGAARSGGRSRSRASRSAGRRARGSHRSEVKQKRKTIDAAAMIAGRSAGSVTSTNVRHRFAPSTWAASSGRGSRCDQSPPTVRTTTA